ncbi:MAG: hypothetical protein OCC45_02665 [Desulfotalea sp.]
MISKDFEAIFEDEFYIVRYSGETPEIALNSSFYFLTRDKNGPQATLTAEQTEILQDAAVKQFSEIVLRDIIPENIGSSIYRGIARTIANYVRYLKFCERQNLLNILQDRLAEQLLLFFKYEANYLEKGEGTTNLNASVEEISQFLEGYFSDDSRLQISFLSLQVKLN